MMTMLIEGILKNDFLQEWVVNYHFVFQPF